MSTIDDMYLNYKEYQNGDNEYVLGPDGYKLENNSKRNFFEKLGYYKQDIGTGMLRGGAKLGEGIISLVTAGAEKFVLGPEVMKKLDPEGDGIVKDIGEYFATTVYPAIGDTETLPGGFAEGITQFLTPGVGYYKLFNGLIKVKGVWPFVNKALNATLAEVATVGTAQVPGDPNFQSFVADLLGVDTTTANNIVGATYNYLATPLDVTDGYDANAVFEEKMKAIISDAPLGPVGEAMIPIFTKTISGMKKIFKGNQQAIDEVNTKLNLSAGASMNPKGPLAKEIEEGTFKTEFEEPDNPYKTPKEPLGLSMTKEELIEGAKIAESGKDWYVRHKPILTELFGDDADFFEELIGITSQQASVDENIERAMVAYRYFKEKGSFKDLEFSDNNELSLLKGVVGNLKRLDGSMESATGPLAADKQIRERMGYSPTKTSTGVETYFAGNKVPDFVEAMKEGTDEVVTMDRHMIQIIFGKKAQVSKYNMAEGKKIVTEIANELGWTPKETQAAIWAFNQIREHDITKSKSKGIDDVRDYKKALEDRAEAIELLVSEFSNTRGSSKSLSTGSSTSTEVVGETTEQIAKTTNLLNLVKNNPDGFSFTIEGKTPSDLGYEGGYMVAPLKTTELIFDAKTFNIADAEKLLDNVEALEKALGGEYNEIYAGGWLNSEDGKYYLDASVRIDNLEDALYIAESGQQIGIFDLKEFNTIDTKEGITKLKQSGSYSTTKGSEQTRKTETFGRRFEEARMDTEGGTE